jgi:HSP20 family protein
MTPWSRPDPEFILNRLQDEMSRMVERVWHGGLSTRPFDGQEWAPAVDIYEHPDRYVAYFEVPGVNGNEIEISHAAGSITIRGKKEPVTETGEHVRALRTERRFGAFLRAIDLPPDVDAGRLSARCTGGVLEITLPKSEAARPKTVKVTVTEG